MASIEGDKLTDATARAIELLAVRGYEETSVAELAEATGVSRSTFFRRFGSKEDIVFADHGFLLQRVETELSEYAGDPLEAVAAGGQMVLSHHLKRPDVSRYRYGLLQSNPELRDRELVASSRYERAFTTYLRSAFADDAVQDWVLVAFAAAAVSLHNLALRSWLRRKAEDPGFDLARELDVLVQTFRPLLGLSAEPAGSDSTGGGRVIVAVLEPGGSVAQVLANIGRTLADEGS